MYSYEGNIYTVLDVENEKVCLDCIHDGSAAKKFKAEFAYFSHNFRELTEEEREEFLHRTPGYASWQDQEWLTHCDNICAFHGDFEKDELLHVYEDSREYLKESLGCNDEELKTTVESYDPNNSVCLAFYKFECLVCNKVLVHTDFS